MRISETLPIAVTTETIHSGDDDFFLTNKQYGTHTVRTKNTGAMGNTIDMWS